VVRVVDGDTIVVHLDGRQQRVRYTGVNTPESVDPRRAVQCFGKEAAARNRALVEGKTVWLEKDVSEADRFGRLLRYVSVDGLLVNAELVREGYARAVTYPPDVRHAERFRTLEREAREAQRGLWGGC
jgi:micrococcal nuclease